MLLRHGRQLGATSKTPRTTTPLTVSSMADSWHGPSSAAMFQSAAPYLTWLRVTALQTQQTATAAQSAAAAVNVVRAAVIPTATVVANRVSLAQLLATNIFGQNLPAIAQTEADYQAMWANNSAAMMRYQAASSQATVLPQLASPASVADPTAAAAQASAVPAAATTSSTAATTAATTPFQQLLADIENSSLYQDLAALESFGSISNNSSSAFGPNANLYNTIFSSGFPDQPAQLSGAEPVGPGVARRERAGRPGRVGRRGGAGWRRSGRGGRSAGRSRCRRGRTGGAGRCRTLRAGGGGGHWCGGAGGWPDGATSRWDAVGDVAGTRPARLGGNAARCRWGPRNADAAAADASADLTGQRLAQAQGSEIRRHFDRCRTQGQSDEAAPFGGMNARIHRESACDR